MSKYRLAPFVKVVYEQDNIVVIAPDNIVQIDLSASTMLKAASIGWFESEELALVELNELGILINASECDSYAETLYRLDKYLQSENLDVRVTQKGATSTAAQILDYGYFVDCPNDESVGFGVDKNKWLAMLKATAEFYERISCNYRRNQDQIVPGSTVFGLENLMKYQQWQLDSPDFKYQNDPSGYWVRAYSLDEYRSVGIPLEYQCYPDGILTKKLCSGNSNGVAAHSDLQTALISSVYELIERDSLMIHWFNKVSREQISIPGIFTTRIKKLNKLGYDVRVVNLTLEIAPVVLVIMNRSANKFPRHVLGLAAAPNAIDAIDKALQEIELSATFHNIDMEYPGSQNEVDSVISHQLWYDLPENISEISCFFNDNSISADDIPLGPTDVVSMNTKLQKLGLEWYYNTLNSTGYATTKIHVVRSVVTSLVPISFGYGCEPLAMDRLTNPPIALKATIDKDRLSEKGYRVQPFA